jgi:WD40 repeat protein
MVIGGAGDGVIRSYKNVSGDVMWASKGHSESVTCLVVCEYWENVVSASSDGTMMAWGIRNGALQVAQAVHP